jgi:hypothetical protein
VSLRRVRIRQLTDFIVESRPSRLQTNSRDRPKKGAPGFEEPSQRIGWHERMGAVTGSSSNRESADAPAKKTDPRASRLNAMAGYLRRRPSRTPTKNATVTAYRGAS